MFATRMLEVDGDNGGGAGQENCAADRNSIYGCKNNNSIGFAFIQLECAGGGSQRNARHPPVSTRTGKTLRCEIIESKGEVRQCCNNFCSCI